MSDYEVIVGNVGTVYEGDSRYEANKAFNNYRESSRTTKGRAAGESVTMFLDGEPEREHQGYQYIFENSQEKLKAVLSNRRKQDPHKCPVCQEGTPFMINARLNPQDANGEIKIPMKCSACGFKFNDILAIVGAEPDQ